MARLLLLLFPFLLHLLHQPLKLLQLRGFLGSSAGGGSLQEKKGPHCVEKVILEEIQKTSCLPREVCVEVAKEYPQSTSQFYLPRCVSLHRCGGCCTNEAFYCTNTSLILWFMRPVGVAGRNVASWEGTSVLPISRHRPQLVGKLVVRSSNLSKDPRATPLS
uniref:Vascular endothelial growth factor C-like n=1 Tax=Oryzias melastigma TaxID=30732 RepID=A0A3B3DAK9_ORYME